MTDLDKLTTDEGFEKRVEEYRQAIKQHDGFDVATECGLKAHDDWDVAAYATAFHRDLFDEPRELDKEHREFVEVDSREYDYLSAALFMASSTMQDAAVAWVKANVGEELADKLEGDLEDVEKFKALLAQSKTDLDVMEKMIETA